MAKTIATLPAPVHVHVPQKTLIGRGAPSHQVFVLLHQTAVPVGLLVRVYTLWNQGVLCMNRWS